MTLRAEGFRGSVRTFLERDHARLAGMFERVLEEFGTDDSSAMHRAWNEFEAGVRDHMAAEEQHLLPLFEQVEPGEAAELRSEHAMLRKRLNELTLRLVANDEILDFSSKLQAHVRREERLLYHWAERGLVRAAQEAVVREISANDRG